MKIQYLFTLLLATLCLLSFAQSEKNEVVSEKIQGAIVKPKKAQPTEAQIKSLRLPPGFAIVKFAEGLYKPRMIKVSLNGTVYVTDRDSGTVTMLRDIDRDGKAEDHKVVFRKDQVHGIEIHRNDIYLVTVKEVLKGKISGDNSFDSMQTIISDLPDGGQHANRTIKVGPDGKLYITVGSTCNACEETNKESATVIQADTNGQNRVVFAKGLRNTIGFDWHPQTKALYGFDHGIDWLGDEEQKEELNMIVQGGDYGWPYIYADGKFNKADEPKGMSHEAYAAKTIKPELLHTAHAAPMDLLFYTGSQFPAEYKNDAFATMHGSWNRTLPSGYNIVRVKFQNGKPVKIDDFVTGFLSYDKRSYFARPVGLALYQDGTLLVTDDALGVVYKITYQGRP